MVLREVGLGATNSRAVNEPAQLSVPIHCAHKHTNTHTHTHTCCSESSLHSVSYKWVLKLFVGVFTLLLSVYLACDHACIFGIMQLLSEKCQGTEVEGIGMWEKRRNNQQGERH